MVQVRSMLITGALCLMLMVSGCAAKSAVQQEPPLPPGAPTGMEQTTAQQFMPVVNGYFYYRKKAVVAGDVEILWKQYPALTQGMDKLAAINAESEVVAQYRSLDVIDGNLEPEHYARFKARVDGDNAVVLVNGMEMFLRRNFDESGGQLQILLYLERRDGVWTVVKTDETTLAEYHQALH
jgi:hypothetical protein